MIATSAFSMGIDVPDMELVVHFNVPISMTDYIQQIGRAGRGGRKAHCVLFMIAMAMMTQSRTISSRKRESSHPKPLKR